MSAQNVFSTEIGGQAGQGIKSAGLMLAKVATRSGYHIYDYTEYSSLIRGGHNVMQVCIADKEVTAPYKKTDFLIALNQETIDRHLDELAPGSGILFDSEDGLDLSKVNRAVNQYPLPLSKLANEVGGEELLINTIALGATVALLGGNLLILKGLISEGFATKGSKIIDINHKAAEAGYYFTKDNFADKLKETLKPLETDATQIIVSGNEAIAMGAIAAGLQFAAIYPMTPVSSILHFLASYQEKYGFIYKQPEDEIAAINMATGASFAGARSMVATSGGGFCLMTEGLGLAGMTETPLVVILGMRPGPATGLPTWSEQGDLQFVLHAHQGDFPRIVLAAGDAKEALLLTMEAFNLADKYQTPVVLLVDENICENDQSFPFFDLSSCQINRGKLTTEKLSEYQRYAPAVDGISLRTIPGSGNFFIANSDEHNQFGYSSEENDNRIRQMEKRMNKLKTCTRENLASPQLFGPEDADITCVSWGSNKGSILQAMKDFPNVNFLHITWMNPFPTEAVKNILERARYLIDIECNYSGQLASLIREKTGIDILDKMLKFNGRPFFVEEIEGKIESVLKR